MMLLSIEFFYANEMNEATKLHKVFGLYKDYYIIISFILNKTM